jgi:hypothetical protein
MLHVSTVPYYTEFLLGYQMSTVKFDQIAPDDLLSFECLD